MKLLKKILILALFFLLSNITYSQVQAYKSLFVQFANVMQRDAFKSKFSLPAWKAELELCWSAKRIAKLLLQFEAGLRKHSKQSSWADHRRKWINFVSNAISISEIAKALYQLELNIRWTAANPSWRSQRNFWVKRIQSLY